MQKDEEFVSSDQDVGAPKVTFGSWCLSIDTFQTLTIAETASGSSEGEGDIIQSSSKLAQDVQSMDTAASGTSYRRRVHVDCMQSLSLW